MTRSELTVAAVSPEPIPELNRQTRPPDETLVGPHALAEAPRRGADWIWVLARGAVPAPDALSKLLEAAELCDAASVSLLAGAVVDGNGDALPCHLPSPDQRHQDLVALVARRVLPIRSLTFANCLVAAECLGRHGLPDQTRYGRFAAVAWSAQVLREGPGYFVPASVVALDARDERRGTGSVGALARTFRAGAWTRGEAARELAWSLGLPPRRRRAESV